MNMCYFEVNFNGTVRLIENLYSYSRSSRVRKQFVYNREVAGVVVPATDDYLQIGIL